MNEETATYSNSIGAAELKVEWTDPDFDASLPALYYARVIEIPTPRWSTYDAARNDLERTPGKTGSEAERRPADDRRAVEPPQGRRSRPGWPVA